MNIKNLSGLQIMQEMCKGNLPMPSMATTIPMSPSEVELGHVTFLVKADERHLNPMGGVHGGFAATVLDTVTGCAIHTLLEAGVGYGTIDLNVKMCRPIPHNQELKAVGKSINLSKNLGISEGQILDDEGRIYAHATATCMIFR
ncbi:phenylacetic acid degradation protein [Acinetobacter sp. LoGeW2-3]|uniref:PaaI family thioesterase n=1 Tax=Acinetobacter sp. LoGeW2-3 TaxID=1808001 RepID=UPI000C0597B8|nr:PaaI family thioesterase [Acinetobacter sp. LoGeW2-3]ATO19969.1 phenylacetic acid degradation protein [Acinetobacter sp. LoGeW2-3]